MARSVKQTAKAPLGSHQGGTGVRTIRAGKASSTANGHGNGAGPLDKPSSWPIYEELVAERGDPTA